MKTIQLRNEREFNFMFGILTELGVDAKIQNYLADAIGEDHTGGLFFRYGGDVERFIDNCRHEVPRTDGSWVGGDGFITGKKQVIIAYSAMECIAFLALNQHNWARLGDVVLIAIGNVPSFRHAVSIQKAFPYSKFTLIFANDMFGALADIVIATGIHGIPVVLAMDKCGAVIATFKNSKIKIEASRLSLHSFQRHIKMRFKARTMKPLVSGSYLESLIDASKQT